MREDCLDPEVIDRLVAGEVEGAALADAETHLDRCRSCRPRADSSVIISGMKDETGRETRTWVGIALPGAECEISELVSNGDQSVVLKINGKITSFDLPPGKLVITLERAAAYLRKHHTDLKEIADQLDREVEMARRDQQRLGVE